MDDLDWLRKQHASHPHLIIPTHLAMIMDGNGRWAHRMLQSRSWGHREGAKTLKKIIHAIHILSIPYLTVYAFSRENWGRPADEVQCIMDLLIHYLRSERSELLKHNIQLQVIGDTSLLPTEVKKEITTTYRMLQNNTGMQLTVALSYSARHEITQATRKIARQVAQGQLDPNAINASHIEDALSTVGMPDPDLLIRTSGEMRLSNFLLWQLAYTELYFAPVHWPAFDVYVLWDALMNYHQRRRKFGVLPKNPSQHTSRTRASHSAALSASSPLSSPPPSQQA